MWPSVFEADHTKETGEVGKRLYPEYDLSRSKLVRELPPPEGILTLDFATP